MLRRLPLLAALLTLPLIANAWPPGGVSVCTDPASQTGPQIAKLSDGFAIVWTDARAGAFTDIFTQKLDAEGRSLWTLDGVVVCEQESTQNRPLVAPGLNGSAILIWDDYRVIPDFLRNPWTYGQRLNSNGVSQWTLNGVLFANGGGSLEPVLIQDGQGGVYYAEIGIPLPPYDGSMVVSGRVDSTGFNMWAKALSRSSIPPSWDPAITGDGAGGAIASWTVLSDSLYVQRLSSTGQKLWSPAGVGLVSEPGNWHVQTLVPEATNGAICVWEVHRSGEFDVYAQRIIGSGLVRWQTNGVPVRVAPGDQANPKAVPDGAGGAIVVWEDRASGLRDIYAQRVDSTGTRLWDTLGVPVIRSTGDQTGIQVVSDDAGGVIVTWQDLRVRNWNIYAQRLNPNGQRLWDTLGVEICVWNGEQTVPVMCQDGSGGAVIAWQDTRNGNSDIYAQRVSASGSGVWEEDIPSPISRFPSSVRPNPFVSFTSVPGHSSERFALYDVSGRKVGICQGDRIGEGLLPGVYFLRGEGGGSSLARIVKVR